MKSRTWLTLTIALCAAGCLRAAETRAELMFAIHTALQTGNRNYLENCFQWDGADPASRGRARAILDEIFRWRSPHIGDRDRDAKVDSAMPAVSLNGDWMFQIQFHDGSRSSASFVFPAGRVGDEVKILLAAAPG